jgi:hypothetical protein
MMKRYFFLVNCLMLALVFLMPLGPQAAEKPNVVFILVDNLGPVFHQV